MREEIAAAEADLQANVTAFRAVGDLSEEAVAAFRRDSQAISAHIRELKETLAALPESSLNTVKAREVHDTLTRTHLADVIADARERGDITVLRELLQATVHSGIVERCGGTRTRWARAVVEWTPEVALLLEAGLLTLGPAPESPALKSNQEQAAERARPYRARKRSG